VTSSKKFTFNFFILAENFFISYLLHSQQAVTNRKVKHNLTCKA